MHSCVDDGRSELCEVGTMQAYFIHRIRVAVQLQSHKRHVLGNCILRDIRKADRIDLCVVAPWLQILGDVARNVCVMGRDDLTAIFPVDLVTVVSSWVMRRCYHDSSAAVIHRNTKWLR